MIPGYPTAAVQSYMRGGAAAPEEKRQQPLKFQLGRIATPIRVTRCGWPSDAGKKCLGGLAVVHDPASIQTLKELEGQVQAQYPQSQLNSLITKIVEDPDTGLPVPIIRLSSRAAQAPARSWSTAVPVITTQRWGLPVKWQTCATATLWSLWCLRRLGSETVRVG